MTLSSVLAFNAEQYCTHSKMKLCNPQVSQGTKMESHCVSVYIYVLKYELLLCIKV